MGIILERGQAVMLAYFLIIMPVLFFTGPILIGLGIE